jgi:triacylglycerol lipase
MCTESIWTLPDGTDYGTLLARDLGFTPVYVRYNSGRPIADNGADLARLLDELQRAWPVPVEEILPIGFSMGGLVIRAACHAASVDDGHFLPRIRRAIYVGTPHLGAPLERAGRVLSKFLRAIPDPYTRLIAELAELRSAGVKDLGDADIRHEDRARRVECFSLRDPRHPVPLLPNVQHYLVAASLSMEPILASLFGDTLVPVPSGTDGLCVDRASIALPPSHVHLVPGLHHITLAHHPDVYAQIRAWCTEAS